MDTANRARLDVSEALDSLQCDARAFGRTLLGGILVITLAGSFFFRIFSDEYGYFLMVSASGLFCPSLFLAWRAVEKRDRTGLLYCLLTVFFCSIGWQISWLFSDAIKMPLMAAVAANATGYAGGAALAWRGKIRRRKP